MQGNAQGKYWTFTGHAQAFELPRWASVASHGALGSHEHRDAVVNDLIQRGASFVIAGVEHAESTGVVHLQGYAEYPSARRFRTLAKGDLAGFHVERRIGSAVQARDYCRKEGAWSEQGEISAPQQGKRTELEKVREALREGKSEIEIADEYFGSWVRYSRAFGAYRDLVREPRSGSPRVLVFWGRTGTGKTRAAWDADPGLWASVDAGGRWFDGYEGQATVLFDDFDGDSIPITFFLKLLDRYRLRVPVKGSFVSWVPRTIFITSNVPPEEWYISARTEHREALWRRLTVVVEFPTDQSRLEELVIIE